MDDINNMTTVDLSFEIDDITAFHLAFTDQPGYWEDYRGGGAKAEESARFEFREGWQTVYPRTVEAMLLRVRLADGTVGWGESNPRSYSRQKLPDRSMR